MKAVETMTPEPKYLAMKNAILGMCMFFALAAAMGRSAPARVLATATDVVYVKRHTKHGAEADDEDGRDAQAHAAIVVVSNAALSGVGHDVNGFAGRCILFSVMFFVLCAVLCRVRPRRFKLCEWALRQDCVDCVLGVWPRRILYVWRAGVRGRHTGCRSRMSWAALSRCLSFRVQWSAKGEAASGLQ